MSDDCYRKYVLKKTLDILRGKPSSSRDDRPTDGDEINEEPRQQRIMRSSDVSVRNPASKYNYNS